MITGDSAESVYHDELPHLKTGSSEGEPNLWQKGLVGAWDRDWDRTRDRNLQGNGD